jgi:hypothetical protein
MTVFIDGFDWSVSFKTCVDLWRRIGPSEMKPCDQGFKNRNNTCFQNWQKPIVKPKKSIKNVCYSN